MSARTAAQRQSSRASLASVSDDGSRVAIHPSDTRGKFTRARRIVAFALIAVYFALPWIPVGGYPAVFLDTEAMRFHFFGMTFATQDLWLAFFLITGLGFGLFYATALAGRVWCGWACPQTVFLEHVYRRIERWIEGDAPKRRLLDKAPWTARKLFCRLAKHAIFIFLSLAIAHFLLAYFVSLPKVWEMVSQAPTEHWKPFIFIVGFAGILYFNFTWFREQLCIIVCPYGRLQSALIDDHSMVIGYDEKRGEPRGKPSLPDVGDCIDCHRCVQVCPTGIDIRQGLQMECIGCANCIDACNEIMDRLDRPRGLIRYDSMEGLAGGKTKIVRPRIILYTILLLIGATVLAFALSGLSNVNLNAWRLQGDPYTLEEGIIRNQFAVRIINTSNHSSSIRLELEGRPDSLQLNDISTPIQVEANGEVIKPIIMKLPRDEYRSPIPLAIWAIDETGNASAKRALNFLGPERAKASPAP